MELGQRQRAYARRASQQEDLAELRNRHEQFRSSMFSSSGGFAPTLKHGTGSSEGAGGGRSVDSDRPPDRIEAAIRAGMAVDAQRGANTFNTIALTPGHSADSPSYQGVDPGPRPSAGRVVGGGGNGTLFGQSSMPTPPRVMHGGGSGGYYGVDSGGGGGGGGGGGSGNGYYVDGGGGVYRQYHPPSVGGGDDGGYPSRPVPADGSGARASLVQREDSHGPGGGIRGGGNGGGGGGGGSRGGGSGSSSSGIGDVFRYSGEDPAHQHPHAHPHPQRGDSGGSGGQSVSSAGGGSTERRRRPPGGGGYGKEAGRGIPPVHQVSGSSGASDERRPEVAGREAFGPPESDGDVTPVKAASGGTGEGGDGGGVTLTPKGYDDPLDLPDGRHHISLAKFLEVMTGPGLRVRKHHRAGKGSSGLRVLRYAPEEDSLTWDSHKILGAAQHVLPMADVTSVSTQSGNRVVLTCVGGRDSYAVFEAANKDAGDVLSVGLERLRKRTVSWGGN